MANDREIALLLAEARARAGLPMTDDRGLAADARTARALRLAMSLGAPVAPTLVAARQAAADASRLHGEVRRASAEGRSVAVGLVLAPPVLGPMAAGLVTDAPLAFLATPIGRAMTIVALLLWLLGASVVWVMVRSAARAPSGADDELLDLVAIAVAAGLALPAAVRAASRVPGVASPLAGAGDRLALWLALGAAGEPPSAWRAFAPVLLDASSSGVPLAPLLHALATRERVATQQRAMERAAKLGARLALPTALLLLPAALLVIAGPLLVGTFEGL